MFAKIKNIWGCITTSDDKLIIEELQEEKTIKTVKMAKKGFFITYLVLRGVILKR